MTNCITCLQPIRPGEETDTFRGSTYHIDTDQCIAAAVRRCVEIASVKIEEMSDLCNMVGMAAADDIAQSIRREFEEVLDAD